MCTRASGTYGDIQPAFRPEGHMVGIFWCHVRRTVAHYNAAVGHWRKHGAKHDGVRGCESFLWIRHFEDWPQ